MSILNPEKARAYLTFYAQSPHPMGSKRQAKLASWIEKKAVAYGLDQVSQQKFKATVPNPNYSSKKPKKGKKTKSLQGINLVGRRKSWAKKPCVLFFASHFDSKRTAPSGGANDGGSSSIGLLFLAKYLSENQDPDLGCEPVFLWFDGEESYLEGWLDGLQSHPAKIKDHLYGSRHFVSHALKDCKKGEPSPSSVCFEQKPVAGLILFDMIGSAHFQLSSDVHTTPVFQKVVDHLDPKRQIFSREKRWIYDDHLPFRERGVEVIDLINFENLDYWHNKKDTVANINLETIEKTLQFSLKISQTFLKFLPQNADKTGVKK